MFSVFVYLVWVLCAPAGALQASVPSVSGLSVVSVLLSGTRASPRLWAETVNNMFSRQKRKRKQVFCCWDSCHNFRQIQNNSDHHQKGWASRGCLCAAAFIFIWTQVKIKNKFPKSTLLFRWYNSVNWGGMNRKIQFILNICFYLYIVQQKKCMLKLDLHYYFKDKYCHKITQQNWKVCLGLRVVQVQNSVPGYSEIQKQDLLILSETQTLLYLNWCRDAALRWVLQCTAHQRTRKINRSCLWCLWDREDLVCVHNCGFAKTEPRPDNNSTRPLKNMVH